jgi:hypothetical protein
MAANKIISGSRGRRAAAMAEVLEWLGAASLAPFADAFDFCVEVTVLSVDLCIAVLFCRSRRLAVSRHARSILPEAAVSSRNVTRVSKS